MTSNRSSARASPSPGGGSGKTPGPSSAPAPASDRQTHSTHIFEVPYRKAPETERSTESSTPSSASTSQQERPSSPGNKRSSSSKKDPPKITPIPRIVPSGSLRYDPPGEGPPPPPKPRHETLAQGLEGKYVDEFGNVLDWDGTVLGRVEGDLPSMVGRPVSDNGEILDTDGEVAGYVSDNYVQPERQQLGGGLEADEEGNIYNQDGAVIGKLNEPPKKDGKKSWPVQKDKGSSIPPAPKPSSAPNPSEIYLDIKSTFDGIQIIMKIPTILHRDHDCAEHDREKTQEERVKYEDRPREDGRSHQ